MNVIFVRAIQGCVLSIGAPLGWLIINLFSGKSIVQEITDNIGLYSYMLFATMFVFALFGIFVGRKEALIATFAIRDALTGIYNLRYYKERMNNEISAARRDGTPLSLIYFDLDHFKTVNDQYGHPAGDEVLRQVAKHISKISRAHDVFARVGGEEFTVLLPRCNLSDAMSDAERIRVIIENLSIPVSPELSINITISLGVVTLLGEESAEDFYQRADKKLYEAKQTGRNRVVG
jgi:diguanylate cyclase (GGDEF)-like protein